MPRRVLILSFVVPQLATESSDTGGSIDWWHDYTYESLRREERTEEVAPCIVEGLPLRGGALVACGVARRQRISELADASNIFSIYYVQGQIK